VLLDYPSESDVISSPDKGFVFANSPTHIQFVPDRKFSILQWREIADWQQALYVFGLIIYHDVFKDAWRHTWFCMVWTGEVDDQMRQCETGTDFD